MDDQPPVSTEFPPRLPSPKPLLEFGSKGAKLCSRHKIVACVTCRDKGHDGDKSDSRESLELAPYRDQQGLDSDDRGELDHCVSVLEGQYARFIPQWDEQLLGRYESLGIRKDYANIPEPLSLSNVSTHYCTTCQFTWIVGRGWKSTGRNHPSHHSYPQLGSLPQRSLLLFTDGTVFGAESGANVLAGLAVYFGPGSKFNFTDRLAIPPHSASPKPAKDMAKLECVIWAMEIVRNRVLRDRHGVVAASKSEYNPKVRSDIMAMRLIVATDSVYVVESICKRIVDWRVNNLGELVSRTGSAVYNPALFSRLQSEVRELSKVGFQVVYYKVRRKDNKEAGSLAKEAERER
ncbi:hypothetical protein VTL71DRAFT_10849 [Oculimacula yallundae]|uniref:RNase H type-1 domain-containing protein n=1 Tax=Oculimacula yallundae TaxID=86028 RepID=A0ABR4CVY9_9HELO